MKFIGQPFKPKRYARRDRLGRLVNMDKSRGHTIILSERPVGKEEKGRRK